MNFINWLRNRIFKSPTSKLVLGALGVVYGDIGTSPLYAVKECFYGSHGILPTPENVLGILSLIVWSITLVVGLKYLAVILRADNKGEGGIIALMALLMQTRNQSSSATLSPSRIVTLGLFGAALLYGDGIITPAISVLSAVEGIQVATPVLNHYVVPLTITILILLFAAQSGGTGKIGSWFGPITAIWFICIAALGIPWIIREPRVLLAFHPIHAVSFFARNGFHGFVVLSAVVLCITGGEALYADMGHFGRRPIRIAWYGIVFPSLILNYLGQGALLLSHGSQPITHPFYALVPHGLLYPMIVLATAATVVASQALISGAFSLTHQATQLGFLPRVSVVHTSEHQEGQIYVPRINQFLMIACILLVLMFRESSNLASAYGIAVTGTMTITTILFFSVARQLWKWSWIRAAIVTCLFLTIDCAFFASNTLKISHGGWVPVAIAIGFFTVMTSWQKGRAALGAVLAQRACLLDTFLEKVERDKPHRVPGTAVFMTPNLDVAPGVLLHHYKHNQVLHERVVLLTVVTKKVPYVSHDEHGRVTDLGNGFSKIVSKYGFMEQPSVVDILECGGIIDDKHPESSISFYLGRETVLTSGMARLAYWRKALFAILTHNAQPATIFFRIPPKQVIEIGSQVEL